ncbi:MAG: hypothetical protein R2769_07285 [Saprospiraceae bacterium]
MLVQCKGGFQIWAKSYDRQMDDIFSIQDEISLLIADQDTMLKILAT